MREILFRGKSVNDGRWIYGDLSNYGDYRAITTTRGFSIIDSCEVIPETVGQYTGLTDKNGKRVFEADILSNVQELRSTLAKTLALDSLRIATAQLILKLSGTFLTIQSFWRAIKHEH